MGYVTHYAPEGSAAPVPSPVACRPRAAYSGLAIPVEGFGGDAVGALISVNVGMPKGVRWRDRTVYTGIWKSPVQGPVMVRHLNIDGDGQGDLGGHGGEQRAVMVYQTESYDFWKKYLGRDDLVPGNFGENFTVTGLPDDDVCIGDRYRIGEAEFEVTQPRVTCFRVGLRLNEPRMPNLLVSQRRPGFYLRVITRRGRALVSAEPQTRPAPQDRRRACAQPRLAAVLPGHARIAAGTRSRTPGRTPGLGRISPVARQRNTRGEPTSDVHPTGG